MAIGTKKQVNVAIGVLAVLGALVVVGGLIEWFKQKRSGNVVGVSSSESSTDATIVTV